ncbi:LPXTG cell wall anchor domain-containing protein [Enterococcus sp. AZ177]|uniref:LPXTG cell wall anchor domain-containing protein n=1 Tax=unclassified Enterococcus TaxID=2608891 RepID=UPI003D2FC936
MNKKRIIIMLASIMCMVALASFSSNVSAADNQNGGQVATEGIITFYEDSTEPTTEPSKPTPPNSSEPKVTKPVGRYPSTGEIIKGSIGISGIVLVAVALFIFFKKRKKEQEADG